MSESHNQTMPSATFSPAELAVIAHLYRGEVYRSTVWRTRLDATTNWAGRRHRACAFAHLQ
jgi:uncharacterized membrane protein